MFLQSKASQFSNRSWSKLVSPRKRSAAKKEEEFLGSLEATLTKVHSNPDFDLVTYKKEFPNLIDSKALTLKELEFMVDSLKVPTEEMGEEMEDPLLEACFVCGALFEKNQGVAVKVPFCGHRAHIECIRRDLTNFCSVCGNGVRSSLFSYIKSLTSSQEAKKQAAAHDDEHLDLEINVPDLN